jgi:molecular chaperone GrpE
VTEPFGEQPRDAEDTGFDAGASRGADNSAFDAELQDLESRLDADTALVDDVVSRVAGLEQELAERTADVQRIHAEYANYRRRVDRDRDAVREAALVDVLSGLLTILDDIDRAEVHDELLGGFRSVGDGLRAAVTKLGLERFGAAGDLFDPAVHEALTHVVSADVRQQTCLDVFQPGYRIGARIVRPARVAVAEPAHHEDAPATPLDPTVP